MKKTYLFVLALCCSLGMLLSGSAFGQTFTNGGAALDGSAALGPWTPYPSDITVTGGPASIEIVTVTLDGLSHTWPGDLDVLLVAPNGDALMLMSDVGGGTDAVGTTLTFGDGFAAAAVPSVTGSYAPTNEGAGDVLDAPADVIVYEDPAAGGSFNSAFTGDAADGTWSLYIQDGAAGDGGDIANGWSITFSTLGAGCTNPIACNYDPAANFDDGSCDFSCLGCTDPTACNFLNDPAITNDDGSCDFITCFGCTDPTAINFNPDPAITNDDGSCVIPNCATAPETFTYCYDSNELTAFTFTEANAGEGVALLVNAGTMEGFFDFFTVYDGVDNTAPVLFQSSADFGNDDLAGTAVASTGASITIEWASDGSVSCASGSQTSFDISLYCVPAIVLGCSDATACNFDATATLDDGSCEFLSCAGCTDPLASNYDPTATIDDGSCVLCNPGEFIVTADMADSAGDGWDGAQLIFSDDLGNILIQNDLDNAPVGDGLSAGSESVCAAPGCYQLDVLGGSFPGEITYTISDNLGQVYYTGGGAVSGQGIDLGLTGSCAFEGCTDPAAINFDVNATVDDGSCLLPPANDLICNAEAVACGSVVTGSTALASDDQGLIGTVCSGIPFSTQGVWYEFNATADQQITASTCLSTSDTRVSIFQANPDCNDVTCIAANDDECGLQSSISWNALTGETYFIYVHQWAFADGLTAGIDFTLEIACVDCTGGIPTNDLCDNATPVLAVTAGTPVTIPQGMCCISVAELQDASPSQFATIYDVWMTINSGTFDAFEVTAENVDNSEVGVAFWSGADCANLTLEAFSGLAAGTVSGQLSDFVTVTPNTTYYVQLFTTDPAGCGTLDFTVQGDFLGCTDPSADNYDMNATLDDGSCTFTNAPANDECANAIALACDTPIQGSTGGATATGAPLNITGCNLTPGAGVWYTFVGTDQLHTLSTCGSSIDTQVNIYSSDSDCTGVLTCVGSATEGPLDSECGFFDSDNVSIDFQSVLGTNYYIYVGSEGGVDGLFDLELTCTDVVEGCTVDGACDYNPLANVDTGCDFFSCTCDANPAGFAVRVDMVDDFGDGWQWFGDQNSYQILDATGTVVVSGNIDNAQFGAVDIDNFVGNELGSDAWCLDAGCYTLSWDLPGPDFGEQGLTIVDDAENVIVQVLPGDALEPIAFTIGGAVCGCTDPIACNFDPLATDDDGSCEFETCAGCLDPLACNFDGTATIDAGNCCFDNCVNFQMNDSFGDGWDGGQVYEVYNAGDNTLVTSGTLADGSTQTDLLCLTDGCYYLIVTEGAFSAGEISWLLTGVNGGLVTGGAPQEQLFFSVGTGDCVEGCDNPIACNYDPAVIISDCTSCEFDSCQGCTYEDAPNYDATALIDDGSCELPAAGSCTGDISPTNPDGSVGDGIVNAGDLLAFLGVFGTSCN